MYQVLSFRIASLKVSEGGPWIQVTSQRLLFSYIYYRPKHWRAMLSQNLLNWVFKEKVVLWRKGTIFFWSEDYLVWSAPLSQNKWEAATGSEWTPKRQHLLWTKVEAEHFLARRRHSGLCQYHGAWQIPSNQERALFSNALGSWWQFYFHKSQKKKKKAIT